MKKILAVLMRDRPSYLEIYIFTFIAFLGCLGILIGIFVLIQYTGYEKKEYYIENLGYLGSYFSGLTSIFILISTGAAVYFSYNAFQEERNRVKRQHLEDRFYHLIEMHRQNVSDMIIEYKGGRIENSKSILNIFRELELIVKILKIKIFLDSDFKKALNRVCSDRDKKLTVLLFEFDGKNILKDLNLDNSEVEKFLYEVAFLIMFIGCGERSSKILINYLKKFQEKINVEIVFEIFSDETFRENLRNNYRFKYKLFGGHQSRLGHYYRNMFHVLKFIDSNTDLNLEEKISYIKNFRVQLNTFEQALLIVNSKTIFGKDWSKYIIKYKLVKNIPKDFFGNDYWFNIEEEIKSIATTKKNKHMVEKELKQNINKFIETYFEFNKHEL
ncbi:putative phage abortive infection protein [Acinetobacter johnsonii]|uniref:putative phage abortive infection protein n=1 Tax=Acinetobacter johnsonii TaxID=40214 RepID=UPI0032B5DDE6